MKILFVLEQLNIGGPQKSLLGLLENIDCEANEIDVLLLQNEGSLSKYLDGRANLLRAPDIIDAFTFPVKRIKKTLFTFLREGGFKLFGSAFILLCRHAFTKSSMNVERQKFWKKNKRYLPALQRNYDIAFGYAPVMSTYYIVDCVKARFKCHWVRCDYRILDMDKEIEEEYFNKTEGIVAVSKLCADIFKDEFPLIKERVTFFYNFIPIGFYDKLPKVNFPSKKSADEIRIITIARMDGLKGVNMALDACLILQEKVSFTWYFVGDGPCKNEFQNSAKEMGLEKQAVFLGFQLNVLSCLRQSDIFVLPSLTEGKSNAVDEAKYCGIPIVVTNYPTAAEQIVHGETGLICGMSGKEIADAILHIIDNKYLAKRMAENCAAAKQINEMPFHLFERIMENRDMEETRK